MRRQQLKHLNRLFTDSGYGDGYYTRIDDWKKGFYQVNWTITMDGDSYEDGELIGSTFKQAYTWIKLATHPSISIRRKAFRKHKTVDQVKREIAEARDLPF